MYTRWGLAGSSASAGVAARALGRVKFGVGMGPPVERNGQVAETGYSGIQMFMSATWDRGYLSLLEDISFSEDIG
jgi:hypothetical protein